MTGITELIIGNRQSGKTKYMVNDLIEMVNTCNITKQSSILYAVPSNKKQNLEYIVNNIVPKKYIDPLFLSSRSIVKIIEAPRLHIDTRSHRFDFIYLDEVDHFRFQDYEIIRNYPGSPHQIMAATTPSETMARGMIDKAIVDNQPYNSVLLDLLLITNFKHKFFFNPDTAKHYFRSGMHPETILTEGFGLYVD